jgi:pyridoxine 5-phosphate synthase
MRTHFQPRLGVNLDHIATLRQLRGTPYPDLILAGQMTEQAGADQITVHLREDRRHIQPEDVLALKKSLRIPLNLEMAVTPMMVKFAKKVRPQWVCFVPEKRQELTTEGGLDLSKQTKKIAHAIQELSRAGIEVSLFIEPSKSMVKLAHELGAAAVEFHTGKYANLTQSPKSADRQKKIAREVLRLRDASELSRSLGVHPHAGHGLDYQNVRPLVELEDSRGEVLLEEYNIGHSIVARAALVGLGRAVREMVAAIRAP